MMRHLVLPAELRVFILERVVTMWARGHDVLRLVPGERLDIGLRELLKKELVADATRRIACRSLLFAEHREVHSRLLEQQRRRARAFLRARVERCRAADPEQIFEGGIRFDRRHAESSRPAETLGVRPAVGVRLVADLLQRFGRRPGEFAFADQIATHVRSEEHTSELQSLAYLVCRLLLEKKKTNLIHHLVILYDVLYLSIYI